jgi:3-oxoacyl-[acyl-carrier protein] reductase
VGDIMYAQKSGKIINISSTNGINTYFPMCLEYDASKSALISLTHNLAVQFAPYVNVNAIAPGFIATESELEGMDDDILRMESDKTLLRRAGTEQDVANLVMFLASEQSSFINNEVIRIDGGVYGNI